MKRSEMIDKVYKLLLYSRKPIHGIRVTESPADKKLAETILNEIEQDGMLPPSKFDTICINARDADPITEYMANYRWEPENED